MYTSELNQKVQVLNGTFKPSEARDIISKMIDDQINFYKLQNLSHWIKDCNISQASLDEKILKLQNTKQELNEIIKEAQAVGENVRLRNYFDLSIEK
ncbi:MAG: hypothetical protein ACJAT4_001602 [Granulosicoccus sp.]|jgi:hypothetical protein